MAEQRRLLCVSVQIPYAYAPVHQGMALCGMYIHLKSGQPYRFSSIVSVVPVAE